MGCKPSVLECIAERGGLGKRKQIEGSCTRESLVSSEDSDSIKFEGSQLTLDLADLFIGEGEVTDKASKSDLEPTSQEETDEKEYPVKRPQDLEANLLTTSVPNVIKILLVFRKDDQQLELFANTSRRLGWNVSVAKELDQSLELFQSLGHELVIIDHRDPQATEADAICRAIRSSSSYHNTVIIALIKKSYFIFTEKDNIAGLELLEIGFSRALMECNHENVLINELVGIYTSAVLPRIHLAAAHSLYVALDRCRDMVHVTNDKHIIQFVNKVSEKLLGYQVSEIIGKYLGEIIYHENATLMEQQLNKGREFEGNMNCKRKNNQTLTISCRVIPFCISLKKPTHYIYVYDTTYLLENVGVAPFTPSGPMSPICNPQRLSYLSNGRRTSDVKSGGTDDLRRSSLQRLHTMNLEAPITRVIMLLTNAAAESECPDTVVQIDKAIEILKTTELYVPHIREDRACSDPVATDLVGALLTQQQPLTRCWESRKSSADSIRLCALRAITRNQSITRLQIQGLRGPSEVSDILHKCLDWDYEIFKLEVLTERRPLLFLGMNIMNMFHVPALLGCEEKTMQNWLSLIEMYYKEENSYHNSTHAADVLQATARFMQSSRLKQILEPMEEVAALIAAAAHDIDHPGRSSQFLCNSNSKLAILYNDLAVLESHHAALTFKLSLSDDSVNIFKNLERETYKHLRQNIIDMILATEMTKHFEHLAKFMNVCSARLSGSEDMDADVIDISVFLQPENVTLVKRMMIKCADVSNPTRPLRCCIEWARRIAEEYFSQTDEEKALKIPIVMPMFDRMTCSIPKSQIGFVDFIINDMIEAWDFFIDMPEMVGYMKQNYEKWKEYNEQGISTLQDIEDIQKLSELQIP